MQITFEKVIQLLQNKGIKYTMNHNKIDLHKPAKPYHVGDKIVRVYVNAEHPKFGVVYTVTEFDSRGFLKTIENSDYVNDPCRVIPYEWITSIRKNYQPNWL